MHTQRLNYRTMAVLALGATLLTGLVLALSLLTTARAAEVVNGEISNEKISQDSLDPVPFGTDYIEAGEYAVNSTGDYAVFIANPSGDGTNADELFSVELPNGDPVRLNLPNPLGRVFDFQITPDGSTVVFLVSQTNSSLRDLYAVPIAGDSAATPLTASFTDKTGDGVSDLFEATNTNVVFEIAIDEGAGATNWLYTIPIGGGTATALHSPVNPSDDIVDFDIAGNSIAYIVNDDFTVGAFDDFSLWSHSVDGTGSATTIVSGTAVASTTIQSGIQIDPVDNEVYFRADLDGTTPYSDTNLYTATLGIADSAGAAINDAPGGFTTTVEADFKIDENGDVLFRADAITETVDYLYREDTAGNPERISPDGLVVPGPDIISGIVKESFVIDGTTVYYIAGNNLYKDDQALVVAANVGTGNSLISDFMLSPDGSFIVFRIDTAIQGVFELYRVNTASTPGSAVKLSSQFPPAAPGNTIVQGYDIAPDNSFVVYIADQETDAVHELYRVNPDGSTNVKLNGELPPGGDVESFVISTATGNAWVIYNADQETNNVLELFISYDAPALSISKDSGRSSIVRGNSITYTINYENAIGAATAPDVFITDTLPSALTNINIDSTPDLGAPTITGDEYVWDLGNLAGGDSGTIIITADIPTDAPLGDIINEVEISSSLFDDPADNTDTDTVEIIGDGPEVFDETYSTLEDTPLAVTTVANGVLENDNESTGGTLEATLDTAPSNGDLTLNTDGTFVYTPTENFNGSDTFIYTVTEIDTGGTPVGSANGTATINVTPVNDPPTIDPLGRLALATSSPSQTITLEGISAGAANETQVLSVTASSTNTVLIADSTIVVDYLSDDTTGTLTFTPTANLTGTAGIEVTVDDGEDTTVETLTVNVRDAGEGSIVFESTPDTVAVVNELYVYNIEVSTVADPATLEITGDVPAWLTLDHTTGALTATLSGTPTATELDQTFPIRLTASDAEGNTGEQTFNIEVVAAPGDATLTVSLTSSATTAATNDTLTYTVDVNNTSLTNADFVTATLTLPTGADYVAGSVAGDGWTFDDTTTAGVIVATRDVLEANSSASFTADVTVTAESGTLEASVTVEAANGTSTPTDTASVTVEESGTTLYLPLVAK